MGVNLKFSCSQVKRTARARGATIWASSHTGDPYFVILGGIIVATSVGFDASSTLGIWHFWISAPFHTFLLIPTMDSHTLVWALELG